MTDIGRRGMHRRFHTIRHDLLPSLSDDELGTHCATVVRLQAAAGEDVELIGYPYGKADERVAAAAVPPASSSGSRPRAAR